MRIGLVTGEYPPMQGGIASHCRVLAETLTAQGHTVAIYTDQQGESEDSHISITHPPGRWRYGALKAIDRWAKEHQLDVVNLHYQTAAYQMSPFIHFLPDVVKSAPVVTTFHDLRFPYLFPKAGWLRDWIVMRLAKASAGVITTNHEDRDRLSALSNVELIPIGSSVKTDLPPSFDREAWRKKVGASAGDFVVAHFGFINHSKGVQTLLQSMAMLVNADKPVRLLMIGGRTGSSDPTNAAYVEHIDAQIEALGLWERVYWTGFVDDQTASAYFTAADAVVLPFLDGASYRRSSLMAAVAHEAAIITTKPNVSIPTFLNGQNLMMVTAGKERALAAAIQILYRSPEMRIALQKGAAELKAVFDWQTIAQANVAHFQRVLEGRKSPR
jgi:glycosyltransferase involved in cell wall biosynthesis